jgi:hypothetical protein
MVSTRRSKNSDGEGSTVTVGSWGSDVANDGSTGGFPMKQQPPQHLPTKVTGVTTDHTIVPRHAHGSSSGAPKKVLAVVVAKKSGRTSASSTVNNNKNISAARLTTMSATSRTAATPATTSTASKSITKSSQTSRRKAGSSVPVKNKTTTTKQKPAACWKKGRAGVSNKMLALQKNPNITIVQYTTGVLYLYKQGEGNNPHRPRAEYVQTK